MSKDKKSLLKRLSNITKKQGDMEKVKREKKKKLKKNKPRGYNARMTGSIVFWVLFGFMFLFVFVNAISGSKPTEEIIVDNKTTNVSSQSATEFTKRFVYDLFNNDLDRSERENKLNQYSKLDLAESLKLSYKTTVDYNDISLKEIEEFEDEKAHHTYSVVYKTEIPLSDDELEKVNKNKDNDKIIEDMMEDDPDIIKITKENKIKLTKTFIVIPLEFNDSGFVINNYPSFTYINENEDKTSSNTLSGLKVFGNDEEEANIKNFLDTFFQSFSNESVNAISYVLDDEKYKYGLQKTLEFERVSEIELYEGKDDDVIANVVVEFKNETTGLSSKSAYLLVLSNRDGKYYVKEINNDDYIYNFINKIDENVNSENNNNDESNSTNNSNDNIEDNSSENDETNDNATNLNENENENEKTNDNESNNTND